MQAESPPSGSTESEFGRLRTVYDASDSMLGCEHQDDILRMAAAFLDSLDSLRLTGVYLAQPEDRHPVADRNWAGPASVRAQLDRLGGRGGQLEGRTNGWAWGAPLLCAGDHLGYLVVEANTMPPPMDRFVVDVLARQTAAAMLAAGRTRQLRAATKAQTQLQVRLEGTLAELARRTSAHELMTDAAIRGDVAEIAHAAHSLTRLPVAIVDQFGYLQASAGEAAPGVWRRDRESTSRSLAAAAVAGRSIRRAKLLIAAAKPGHELLGGVLMLDADRTAGAFECYVLDRTAALLSGEMANRRDMAEMEMALRRELVGDLVDGVDDDEGRTRAGLLGHDLNEPHRVVAIHCEPDSDLDWVGNALRRVASPTEVGPLMGRRRAVQLAVMQAGADVRQLHAALKSARPEIVSSVGLGDSVMQPSELPRSYAQALRALRVRQRSPVPDGGTDFADLGLYQILEDRDRNGAVDAFVRRWLGPLIDYDAHRRAKLVSTLACFLDCGGNYDQTASSLLIHRSTLRYRLRRIQDVSGLDLGVADTRLNVHVATRAWHILAAD